MIYKNNYSDKKIPRLTLAGAGSGDPELITLKAIRALQSADVVLYDALANEILLDYCPAHCEKIYVGKKPHQPGVSQDNINFLIVEKALEKGHVVRLKGGDPFVFGRGQEEMSYAAQFGIATTYIPGISSVLGAGQAGIPLTARGVSESFWVITGTTSDGSLSQDLKTALQTSATIVILMGMGKLPLIASLCVDAGKADLPVAIVQHATLPNQQSVAGQAHQLPELASKNGLGSPAIIVLGEVVRFYNTEKIHKLILSESGFIGLQD